MNAPAQFSMFGAVTTPSSSPIGLAVILLRPCCNCGDERATIGSSAGPHHASLNCYGCGGHRGWLSGATFKFLSDVIENFGRPTEPITVSSNSRKSADTTATATER
jgi:hypothetical protein